MEYRKILIQFHQLCWLALLLSGSLCGGLVPAETLAQADRPCIILQPESLDFGVVHQLEHFSEEVNVRNAGTAVLEIQQITTSCGCAVAETAIEQLAPGEATVLTVNFSSKRFLGPQSKWIRLHTNDPDQPVCELPIYADVRVPIEVDPQKRRLAFGKLQPGEIATREAWLRSAVVPELEIEPTVFKPDLLTVTIVPDPDGNPQRIGMVVQASPAAPSGSYREIVRLQTNVPTMPQVDFEVSWDVLHSIELSHYHIDFRYVKPGQKLLRKLRVWAADPAVTFSVTGVEIDLPSCEVKAEPVKGENATLVTLEGRALPQDDPLVKKTAGRLQGTLRVFTDHPEQPELQAKVTYILRI